MTRPRRNCIKVYVKDDELSKLTQLATSANLPLSGYLRAAGLNRTVRSILDIKAVEELAKVNGDLGRMAEVLKDSPHSEVPRIIKEIRELQTLSHQIMGRILR
jgi:hypothetical protein